MKTSPRFRTFLRTAARRRTSRRRLMGVFVATLALLLAMIFGWYLPHRPDAQLARAVSKSLDQRGLSFRLTASGPAAMQLTGKIDRQGESQVEVTKNGQRLTIITSGSEAYVDGGDGRWLSTPLQSAQAMLPGSAPVGVQPSSLNTVDRQRLERLYRRHSFLEVSRVFDEEVVAGGSCYHYQVKVNRRELRNFLRSAQHDVPSLKIQNDHIATIMSAALLDRPFEIWINKTDGLVRQLAYDEATAKRTQITIESYGDDIDVIKPQAAAPLLDTLRP